MERMEVKIDRIPSLFGRPQRVKEKSGDQEFSQFLQDEKQQEQEQNENPEESNGDQVTEEQVRSAIEDFSQDRASRQAGLKASQAGTGPGLKVVLQDGSGTVIREFSGQEFIELREEVDKKGLKRGKIVDVKL